ncbi:RNA helicase (nucleomorph) [Guillardia theta]|uniref:RNA helicase n=1 Tax=Guillardia theta TaxID=55529 RepID=Q9SEV5_GUITH|nr:RNA helicase [Guillardia theta]AAF24010.1 RNA helicase [Guillardia theta]
MLFNIKNNLYENENLKFKDLKLKNDLLLGLNDLGYEHPSLIQEKIIPLAINNKDILARSKNGTGKTLSFLIPILQNIYSESYGIESIILVPTRELALQISSLLRKLSKYMKNINLQVTGVDSKIDKNNIDFNILLGTPGKIYDCLCKNEVNKTCKTLVLDEADKLLSGEVYDTTLKILNHYKNKISQIMLFSATFPYHIQNIKKMYMNNPIEVNLMNELVLEKISQFYAYTSENKKIQCIKNILSKVNINQSVFFCNSVNRVELLAKKITDFGYPCYFIHAKMRLDIRNKIFHDFRIGKSKLLVSSDLITRGIDIPNINLVVNFDLPLSSESYLHRIGRTGRFGKHGIAISLITEDELETFFRIENELGIEIHPITNNKIY